MSTTRLDAKTKTETETTRTDTKSDTGARPHTETTVTATIRIPLNASATMLDVATDKLQSVDGVHSAVITNRVDVAPKNGAIYVTVNSTIEIATSCTERAVVSSLADTVGIDVDDAAVAV